MVTVAAQAAGTSPPISYPMPRAQTGRSTRTIVGAPTHQIRFFAGAARVLAGVDEMCRGAKAGEDVLVS